MLTSRLTAVAIATLAATACAKSTPVTTGTNGTSGAVATDTVAAIPSRVAGGPHWVASLQPIYQRTGDVRMTAQTRAYGQVSLYPGRTPERSLVSITYTTSQANTLHTWSLHSGRCGSGELAVAAQNLFPALEVGTNGRAQASIEIPFSFPQSGSYHVNVFAGSGAHLEDVVSCANLRLVRE